MGVTIGYAGTLNEEVRVEELEALLRSFAEEEDWGLRPLELTPEAARVGPEILHRPRIKGVALLPHAAADPLPFLIEPTTRSLVDSYAHLPGDDAVVLNQGALVNTHFAGSFLHYGICRLLHRLQEECFSDLVVDDETGYFATADEAALQRCYEEAWQALRRGVQELLADGARRFEVAGFSFHLDDRGPVGEFELVSAREREFIEELDSNFLVGPGILTTFFADQHANAVVLDGTAEDAEEERGGPPDPEDPQAILLAHELGAAFGRILTSKLGGHWRTNERGHLVVGNVCGLGLRVDPFEVAAHRIMTGPEHGFGRYFDLFESFQENLRDL